MKITSITIYYKQKYAIVEYGHNPVMRKTHGGGSLIDFLPEELAFIQKNSEDKSKVTFVM